MNYFKTFILVFAIAGHTFAKGYKIDASHSTMGFTIPHMTISRVNGAFKEFEGTIDFEKGNPKSFKASVTIKTNSIDTLNAKRDDHLKNADFFDVNQFPTITFKTASVKSTTKNRMKVLGSLTMHGITKEIEFDMEYLGEVKDPWGNMRTAFSGTSKLNRKDFGLTWHKVLETGGLVVGDEVSLNIQVEAVEEKVKNG